MNGHTICITSRYPNITDDSEARGDMPCGRVLTLRRATSVKHLAKAPGNPGGGA